MDFRLVTPQRIHVYHHNQDLSMYPRLVHWLEQHHADICPSGSENTLIYFDEIGRAQLFMDVKNSLLSESYNTENMEKTTIQKQKEIKKDIISFYNKLDPQMQLLFVDLLTNIKKQLTLVAEDENEDDSFEEMLYNEIIKLSKKIFDLADDVKQKTNKFEDYADDLLQCTNHENIIDTIDDAFEDLIETVKERQF